MTDRESDVIDVDTAFYNLWTCHKNELQPRFQSDVTAFFRSAVRTRDDTTGQIVRLSLTYTGLTGCLSYCIGAFSALQELNLAYNSLTRLPAEIGQLVHLRELNVSDNDLTSLPVEIGQLVQLRGLAASLNQLTQLPPQIGHLTSLERLDVCDNRLSALPPQIGGLIKLRELRAHKNYLTCLPDEISELSATLCVVGLGENAISAFPLPILNLTSLQTLHLGYNELASIPSEIERLSQLEFLHVQGNRLTWIPSGISKLSKMKELQLQGNALSTIPSTILALPHLARLIVTRNCLLETYVIHRNKNRERRKYYPADYHESSIGPLEVTTESFAICPTDERTEKIDQRLPSSLQLEAFASCPIVKDSLRPNFRLVCRDTHLTLTLVPCYIDIDLLAQRWQYLRNLLGANMRESKTRVLQLHEYFSIRLVRVIVALFYGEAAIVSDLDTRDCQDLIDHGEQFLLDEPLELLVIYCKSRIHLLIPATTPMVLS